MSDELLQKLEGKVDNAVETIELLRLQIEELDDKYVKLLDENAELKKKQATWELNLTTMLEKLDTIEPAEMNQASSKVHKHAKEDVTA